MPLAGSTPIFSIGDQGFDWADVKRAAVAWGDARRVEDLVRAGLASLLFLEADENEIAADRLEAASDGFREERNLISAEEMTAWLEARGLEAEEWVAFIERSLARERCAAEIEEIVRTYPVEEADVAAAFDAEVICSGVAAGVAQKLAAVAAVFVESGSLEAALPETATEDERRGRIERLAAKFDELRSGVLTAEGLARLTELRRFDWTILECRLASFAEEDAAREVALCVSEDGEDFAQVASDAGTRVEESSFLLQDFDADVQPKVLSAPQGKLVGPWPFRGLPTLLIVDVKGPPHASHAMIRPIAERALVEAAIAERTRATRFQLNL